MSTTDIFIAIFILTLASSLGAILMYVCSTLYKLNAKWAILVSFVVSQMLCIMLIFAITDKVMVYVLCAIYGSVTGVFDIESLVLFIPSLPFGHWAQLAALMEFFFHVCGFSVGGVISFFYNRLGSYSLIGLVW